MSAVRRRPGSGLAATRYRRPCACTSLRTSCSGLVSRLRIACMLRRRAAEEAQEPAGRSQSSVMVLFRSQVSHVSPSPAGAQGTSSNLRRSHRCHASEVPPPCGRAADALDLHQHPRGLGEGVLQRGQARRRRPAGCRSAEPRGARRDPRPYCGSRASARQSGTSAPPMGEPHSLSVCLGRNGAASTGSPSSASTQERPSSSTRGR